VIDESLLAKFVQVVVNRPWQPSPGVRERPCVTALSGMLGHTAVRNRPGRSGERFTSLAKGSRI
jgi:hypothetical protein